MDNASDTGSDPSANHFGSAAGPRLRQTARMAIVSPNLLGPAPTPVTSPPPHGVLHRDGTVVIQTVQVICTGGQLGDLPGGLTPEGPSHDPAVVVRTRMLAPADSYPTLGTSKLELPGYPDSGMEK